jgi:hypothetical protein
MSLRVAASTSCAVSAPELGRLESRPKLVNRSSVWGFVDVVPISTDASLSISTELVLGGRVRSRGLILPEALRRESVVPYRLPEFEARLRGETCERRRTALLIER